MNQTQKQKRSGLTPDLLASVDSGGGGGTRTPDLYSAIVALSQLSYAPQKDKIEYTDRGRIASKSGPIDRIMKVDVVGETAYTGQASRG